MAAAAAAGKGVMAEVVTVAEVEVTTAEVEAATVAEVIAEAEATEARATDLGALVVDKQGSLS